MSVRSVAHGVVAACVAGLFLGISGSAWHPPWVSQEPPIRLGVSIPAITVTTPFSHGEVTWRQGVGRWQQSPWTHPPSTMPTPLRTSLAWVQDLVAGQWPGSPVPEAWASWAGHVKAPIGWVVGPISGRSPGLSVLIILPARAPYQGAGGWYSVWTRSRGGKGHWSVSVGPPEALSESAVAALLRHRPK